MIILWPGSAVKIVPGMQLRLFTWKGGEDIDVAVIPEEPGPPHALLQFAFKGVQLNLLQGQEAEPGNNHFQDV